MLAIRADTFSNALKNTNILLLENLRDAHNQKNKDLREQFTGEIWMLSIRNALHPRKQTWAEHSIWLKAKLFST